MALIELDAEPTTPAAPSTPPPAYFYRRVGLALAAVLVLALGGAAPASSVLWHRIGAVPLTTGNDFQLVAGRIYTTDLTAGRAARLQVWQTDPIRRLWERSGPSDNVGRPFVVNGGTADVTLLRVVGRTEVVDAHTGAVRWTSPGLVQKVTDTLGFVEEERFRPGTEYDTDSGAPGLLYGMTSDVLHTEPARSTELSGVELATGRPLWSLSLPGSVFADQIGDSTLVVLSADKLTVRSSQTGAVLRERSVPRVDGELPAYGEVTGDLVLVHYGEFDGNGATGAYALDSLDQRWQQQESDPAGNTTSCYGMPCLKTRTDLEVLDPHTGRTLWGRAGADLLAFGDHSVLEVEALRTPLQVADRDTGRPGADLRTWSDYARVAGREAFVLSRPERATTTGFGLLTAGATVVQPLGVLPAITSGCQAGPAVVACRTPDHVEVWSYHA